MPRAAVEANAVRETVSLDRMGARLQALLAGGEEKERE
jgi:chemotaxis response regulator CheB